jgi:hypothetical protein
MTRCGLTAGPWDTVAAGGVCGAGICLPSSPLLAQEIP